MDDLLELVRSLLLLLFFVSSVLSLVSSLCNELMCIAPDTAPPSHLLLRQGTFPEASLPRLLEFILRVGGNPHYSMAVRSRVLYVLLYIAHLYASSTTTTTTS